MHRQHLALLKHWPRASIARQRDGRARPRSPGLGDGRRSGYLLLVANAENPVDGARLEALANDGCDDGFDRHGTDDGRGGIGALRLGLLDQLVVDRLSAKLPPAVQTMVSIMCSFLCPI